MHVDRTGVRSSASNHRRVSELAELKQAPHKLLSMPLSLALHGPPPQERGQSLASPLGLPTSTALVTVTFVMLTPFETTKPISFS